MEIPINLSAHQIYCIRRKSDLDLIVSSSPSSMSKMILSKLGTIIALVILLTENCSCAFSPSSLGSRLIAPAQSRSDVHVSPPITSSCLPTTRQHTNDEHFILYAKIDSNEDREGSLAAATKALGKVPYGEISRKYRRTVFKHDDWVNHRQSNSKVFDNLQSMFFLWRCQAASATSWVSHSCCGSCNGLEYGCCRPRRIIQYLATHLNASSCSFHIVISSPGIATGVSNKCCLHKMDGC